MVEKQLRSSNLSDRAKKIVKRMMKKEKDKEVEVGWCKSIEVVDHTGIVLAMNKKKTSGQLILILRMRAEKLILQLYLIMGR